MTTLPGRHRERTLIIVEGLILAGSIAAIVLLSTEAQWEPFDLVGLIAVLVVGSEFRTLREFSRATGQDRNSVLVDYDVFVDVPKLDAQDAASVQTLYDARELDFRLRPGSAAVDRGTALATVTEGFAGRAPDLGALELGAPLPVYGPRP